MQTFKYKISCDEFPDGIEQDSITYPSNFEHSPQEVAQELAESYMHNYIYDWEDDTEPGDLFHIDVAQYGPRFNVTFWSNGPTNSHIPDHVIVVELEVK